MDTETSDADNMILNPDSYSGKQWSGTPTYSACKLVLIWNYTSTLFFLINLTPKEDLHKLETTSHHYPDSFISCRVLCSHPSNGPLIARSGSHNRATKLFCFIFQSTHLLAFEEESSMEFSQTVIRKIFQEIDSRCNIFNFWFIKNLGLFPNPLAISSIF